MSHTIPPLDELKRKAYCMWHNFFLMLLMIVMFSVDMFNRPLIKNDWPLMKND
jgi:hypothetical protein